MIDNYFLFDNIHIQRFPHFLHGDELDRLIAISTLIRGFNIGADDQIMPLWIVRTKDSEIGRIKPIGIDFAFNGIHLLSPLSDDKIHFAAGFVPPVQEIGFINYRTQTIKPIFDSWFLKDL